ncbi:23 kDa jasmonate-induced protein-like [Camellia sinensis]|uniref:23 kDa jasmonate-induced protein-like n=1 Tax=Camellia sinensis TaxID=4442 RepID=UPI0010357B1E|nr:23 kDa jasmonate-induced protein-like [Camellia sinensis]
MANNVFGNPITNETLEGMPEYVDKEITRRDRAHVAMLMKNAENKDDSARNHVQSLKNDFGDGISTLYVIYNATGDNLKFITTHDYHGHIYADPYPTIIQNGQWAAFLHVKPSVITAGSSAGVVYRGGQNQSGKEHDWMLAWSIPYIVDNHAYTEIREVNHYKESNDCWGTVSDKMGNTGLTHEDNWYQCVSYTSIGNNTSPVYEGIMTLEGA